MGFSVKFILIFALFYVKVYSQQYTPDDYENAADIYGQWLIRGLHHESLQSATPIGRYRRTMRGSFPNLPLKFANEFGYSLQNLPLTADMLFAQKVFGANAQEDLKINRFHFSQAFNLNHDLSLSGIFNPDLKLYGFGIDLKFNLLNVGNFLYTSLRGSYSQNKRQDQFDTKTYSVDLIQSLNLYVIDFYAGLRYLDGSAKFNPDPMEFEFEQRKYQTSDEFEKFYGMVLVLTDSIRLSAQYNQLDEEKSLFIKIAFGAKTMVKFIPERYQNAID
jgi:hypothetical protein